MLETLSIHGQNELALLSTGKRARVCDRPGHRVQGDLARFELAKTCRTLVVLVILEICTCVVGAYMSQEQVLEWVAWLKQQNLSEIVHQVFWWLVLFAAFGVLRKLKTVRDIVADIRHARSPIWDLRDTVDQLDKLEPIIKDFKTLEPLIRKLGEDVPLLFEKVDASNKKLNEIQLDSVGARTEAEPSPGPANGTFSAVADEDRWPELQEYWRRNTRRLEFVIENIPDGRTRLAFDRMSRNNYKSIIDRLEAGGYIQKASANGSRALIELFNSYRPRNRKTTAAVIEPLAVLDRQLDDGIVAHDRIWDAESGEPRPPKPTNQGAGFYPPRPSNKATVSTDNIPAN